MTSNAFPIANPAEPPPFMVHNRRTAATKSGTYTPAAETILGPSASIAQLMHRLSDTELATLIAVLSLVTPNGRVYPCASEVALTLGIARVSAYVRLYRLAAKTFRGAPVLVALRLDGVTAFIPSGSILGSRIGPLEPLIPDDPMVQHRAGRGAVVAASRQRYARPRKIVEQEIASVHGWTLREEQEAIATYLHEPEPKLLGRELQIRNRLIRLGVELLVADELVRTCGADVCARQIAWLPFRNSKSPAKLLIASIHGDYSAPPLPKTSSASDDRPQPEP